MSFISKTSSKPNKRRFSRFSKIRKSAKTLKNEKVRTYEAIDMDGFSAEPVKRKENEWTINILKNNIRQQILESTRRLKRNDSWLLSMEKNEIKQVENISKCEANNAFLWAAFLGKFDLMIFFESQGADVSYANENENFNALHLCALNGSVECCKWLYEKGCPVLQTFEGLTPMHYAVLSDSKDVVEFLINDYGCCIPDTVINSAVYANAAECVKLLLSLFVDVNTYHEGMTPLHIATDLRHIECLKELLNIPSIDVNLKTESRKNTALHLAAENGYADCIELLLMKQARIDEVNLRQETALYLACKMNHLDCVKILLENRASVNKLTLDLRTSLHAAISDHQGCMDIVKLLVHWKANINASDRYGYTPLHLAAIHEFEECATYLILNGANPAAETRTGLTALNIICRKIPGSVPAMWKRFTKNLAYNSEQNLKFDFRELITNSRVGETGFLYALYNEGHREMLQHPLCKAFLHLKWQKIKWYYYFRVLLIMLTVCALSFVVIIDLAHDCHNDWKEQKTHQTTVQEKKNICRRNIFNMLGIVISQHRMIHIAWTITTIMLILNVIRKLFSIVAYSSFKKYFRDNYNLTELVLTLTTFSLYFQNHDGRMSHQQKFASTFAVLLAWIYLTLNVGQLPYFGTYITMFKKVLKELLKLLSVYFCLLFGFTITFGVIFPTESEFTNPITGFVHTLAMMTGELNLGDVTKGVMSNDDGDTYSYYGIAVYSVLFAFIVLVTMALMNLLIGIAVSDVEGLQKTADVSKLVHQTQLMYFLELSFFHGYIPKKLTNCLKKRVFVCPKFQNVVLYVKPLNSQEQRLPKDVMLEGMKMALDKHKQSGTEEKLDISSRMEVLENKLSEIYNLLTKLTNNMQNMTVE